MKNIIENLTEINGIADTFPVCSKAFKQLQIQETLTLPDQKPDIEQIVSVTVKVVISKTYAIETARGISCEGQILTGAKLIIEGKLQQKVEYVADNPLQAVHAAHFEVPFSSFIVLGEDINCSSDFEVTGYIEDVYIKQLGRRKIFKNVLFVLNAVPMARS